MGNMPNPSDSLVQPWQWGTPACSLNARQLMDERFLLACQEQEGTACEKTCIPAFIGSHSGEPAVWVLVFKNNERTRRGAGCDKRGECGSRVALAKSGHLITIDGGASAELNSYPGVAMMTFVQHQGEWVFSAENKRDGGSHAQT